MSSAGFSRIADNDHEQSNVDDETDGIIADGGAITHPATVDGSNGDVSGVGLGLGLPNDSESQNKPEVTSKSLSPEEDRKWNQELDNEFQQMSEKMKSEMTELLAQVPEDNRKAMRESLLLKHKEFRTYPNRSLIDAVRKHNTSLAKRLLEEFRADPEAFDDEQRSSVLMWAAWFKNHDMVKYLLNHKASVQYKNPKLQTCLHWACMGGDIPCVKALLAAGADLALQDADGYYPVHCAAQHGHTEVIEYLKMMGADIMALDNSNRTLLHWSAYKDELITTQYLLHHGVPVGTKDSGGRTALHWAASKNNVATLTFLISELEGDELGLLDDKDNDGLTPRELAEKKGSQQVARFLKQYEKTSKSSFWSRWERMFCMSAEKKKYTQKSRAGVRIAVWFFIGMSLHILHYAVAIFPESSIPRDVVPVGVHIFAILSLFLAVILWIVTNQSDPGYVPTPNKVSTRRGAQRGSSNSRQQREREEVEEEKAVMLQMDSLAEDQDNLTYEKCLEQGRISQICVTCRITKPIRSKHCRDCDRCVYRFDHHCPWVNTCVGEGNHIQFVLYCFVFVLACVTYFAISVVYLQQSQNQTPLRYIMAIPLMIHALMLALYVFLLLTQQLQMIFKNMTTNEKINVWRYDYFMTDQGTFSNPFDQGYLGNCLAFFKLRKQNKVAHRTGPPPSQQPVPAGMGGHGGHGGRGHGHSHGGGGGHGHSHGGGSHGHSH